PSFLAREQSVALEAAPRPALVEGDPVRLEQIVSNLAHNASKYTPPRGHVRVAVTLEGPCAAVSVSNDGIGIRPEFLEKIFEVFTQLDVAIDRSQGGLGLGLPLVRGLVELHGGTVTAASAGAGAGATFTVRLPLAAEPLAAPASRPTFSVALAPGEPRRVLIVEDNDDLRGGLREVLEGSG